jgi:hypothetical protein
MPIEAADFVQGLVPDNPPSDDLVQEGDNHLRLIKAVLQNTFPNANRAIYDRKATSLAVNTTLTAAMDKQVITVNASSGDKTITLPNLNSARDGWSVLIMKNDASANVVKIEPNSGSIQSQANIQLAGHFECAELIWTGVAWVTDQRHFRQWIDQRQVNADTTLTFADFGRLIYANPTSANIELILPTVVNFDGAVLGVKHIGTNGKRVTLNGNASQEIDGNPTYSFDNNGDCVWLVNNGTAWQTYAFKVGQGFSPNQINNWTATQIFVGASLVLAEQTLTINANNNVAWNHDLGNHAKILVDEDCTFLKPTNMRIGQSGFLRITVSGNRDIEFASTFFFLQGQPPMDGGSVTILEYFVSAANNIYIWPVSLAGGFTDYNKGQLNNATQFTQAHGLGRLPAAVQGYMKCVNANNGYAVGDYVLLPSSPVGDNDRGSTISFNTTTAFVQTGNGGQSIFPQGSGNAFVATESDWQLVIRVYA